MKMVKKSDNAPIIIQIEYKCTVWNISGTSAIPDHRKICKEHIPLNGQLCDIKDCNNRGTVRGHITDTVNAYLCALCYKHNHYTNTGRMELKIGSRILHIGTMNTINIQLKEAKTKKESKTSNTVQNNDSSFLWKLGTGIFAFTTAVLWFKK